MADCSFTDVTCHAKNLVTGAAADVIHDAFDRMCHSFADAGSAVLEAVARAFLATSTIDLKNAGIDKVFTVSAGIGAGVALLLLLGQVIRTAVTMRGEHLATGLVGVFKAGLVIASVMTVAGLLLTVADQLSQTIMDRTAGGSQAFTARFSGIGGFNKAPLSNPAEPVALLLIYGGVGFLVGLTLFAEMLFRHALVVVMVAVSPIAAAGMVAGARVEWWRKHLGAGLRLIFLKPLIVLIFGVSFAMASNSTGILNVLAGLMTLLVAACAWPLLAKVCTVSAGHVSAAGGPGAFVGGLFGAGAGMALTGRAASRQAHGTMFESDRSTITRNVSAMNQARAGSGGLAGGLAAAGGGAYAAFRIAAHAKDHLKSGFDQMAGHAGLGGDLHSPYPLRYDLGPQLPPASIPPDHGAAAPPPTATPEKNPTRPHGD